MKSFIINFRYPLYSNEMQSFTLGIKDWNARIPHSALWCIDVASSRMFNSSIVISTVGYPDLIMKGREKAKSVTQIPPAR